MFIDGTALVSGSREGAVLAVVVSFLILLVAILALVDRHGKDGTSRAIEDKRLARYPAEPVGRLNVELTPVPPPVRAPAPTPDVDTPSMLRRDLDPGTFPEILTDYQSIGFDVYTRMLSGIGARFFVVRKPAFTVVGEVDPVDFDLITDGRRGPLNELSPRSRDISTEPRLQDVLTRATAAFGDGQYGAVMLLPLSVERHLMTALGEIGRGGDGQVDIFVCAYRVVNGGLTLLVSEIRTTDGRAITVNRSVNLRANG